MLNGHRPTSMQVTRGFDPDPLRKPTHQVVASSDGGKTFTIIGASDEPLTLLKMRVGGQHAVGFSEADVKILDEERTIVADFPSYHVEPQEGPPSEERLKVRDRWLDNVCRFLLPARLYAMKDEEGSRKVLARWFRKKRITIEMRPDGDAVRVFRSGKLLCEWGC